jgi:hypothetical protein
VTVGATDRSIDDDTAHLAPACSRAAPIGESRPHFVWWPAGPYRHSI